MVDQISKALLRIVSQSDGYAKAQRAAVSELFQAVVSILPRIDTLVRRADFTMSDSITIQAVFIAIGPFFVADPTADGKNSKGSIIISTLGGPAALRGLNLSALSLIRSVRDLSMTVSRFLTRSSAICEQRRAEGMDHRGNTNFSDQNTGSKT